MALRSAILGWGSLLWDAREDFDRYHHDWGYVGPTLKIEFSRVSVSRDKSLTLVLDEMGALCKVAYALSTRVDPNDAICNLRSREGTTLRNIGCYFADGSRSNSRNARVLEVVKEWAKEAKMDVVVWSDLPTNFKEKSSVQKDFSVIAAIEHLQGLDAAGRSSAFEYVSRAPDFVKTPLRDALTSQPWFGV